MCTTIAAVALRAPDWLARITGRRRLPSPEPSPEAEAALWNRFEALARANGMTPPPLEVLPDPRGRLLPVHIDWTEEEHRVLASSTLVAADPHEQTWHLATALGWWASPGPRRTRNRGRVALVLVALPYGAFGLVDIFGGLSLPKPVIVVLGIALTGTLSLAQSWVSRRQVAARDAAAGPVLRRAGHDPATLARLVFGDQPAPAWYRRPFTNTPAPSRRLTAAARAGTTPAPALF
jgi:hypothetical protein